MSNAATTRNAATEIAHLGLTGKVSACDYIVGELRRSLADMPKGDPMKAARAVCADFGISIAPEHLLAAARAV